MHDWKTLTAIYSCSCRIGRRMTPFPFRYKDHVYKQGGSDGQALEVLIMTGLIAHVTTSDAYTLKIPKKSIRLTHFDEQIVFV